MRLLLFNCSRCRFCCGLVILGGDQGRGTTHVLSLLLSSQVCLSPYPALHTPQYVRCMQDKKGDNPSPCHRLVSRVLRAVLQKTSTFTTPDYPIYRSKLFSTNIKHFLINPKKEDNAKHACSTNG